MIQHDTASLGLSPVVSSIIRSLSLGCCPGAQTDTQMHRCMTSRREFESLPGEYCQVKNERTLFRDPGSKWPEWWQVSAGGVGDVPAPSLGGGSGCVSMWGREGLTTDSPCRADD